MPSSPNNSCSSSKPKPKANKKSSSSSFGFKRGFLNKTVSSSSSSSGLSTTVVPPSAAQTAGTTSNKNATAAAAAASLAPPPVQEWGTCAICCYPLPLNADEIVYNACCGETICLGCIMGQKRTLIIGTDVKNPVNGSKEEELEFEIISLSEERMVCPFCRAEGHEGDDKELLKRLFKQIDKYKDPRAMIMAGVYHVEGLHGVSKDLTKAEEFYKRSYDLGYPMAAHRLYELFHNHIPDADKMVAMKYLEEGARRGLAHSIFQLAHHVYRDGNRGDGTRRFMMAARCGHENAMDTLMKCYRQGLLSNEDLATTVRDYKAAMEAVTSEPREYAKRYNKFVTKLYETRNMNIKNYS